MKITATRLPGVMILEPALHKDDRGLLLELWNQDLFIASGLPGEFIQDNLSRSASGCLRGLHFQYPTQQGKLVTALSGRIFDVAVDIRRGSPTFGHWVGMILDDVKRQQLWIPRGFAHGFLVLSEQADVFYKADAAYRPEEQHVVAHDDPALGIEWPAEARLMSEADRHAPHLDAASILPAYTTEIP